MPIVWPLAAPVRAHVRCANGVDTAGDYLVRRRALDVDHIAAARRSTTARGAVPDQVATPRRRSLTAEVVDRPVGEPIGGI